MKDEGGVGDGSLHLIDCIDHFLVDVELLLGGGHGVSQGVDDVGEAGKEMAIKITHPQQSLDVQLGRWRRELSDGGDLLREGADPLGVHHVTEEGRDGLSQDALVHVHSKVVLSQAGEDLPEVLLVLLDVARTY